MYWSIVIILFALSGRTIGQETSGELSERIIGSLVALSPILLVFNGCYETTPALIKEWFNYDHQNVSIFNILVLTTLYFLGHLKGWPDGWSFLQPFIGWKRLLIKWVIRSTHWLPFFIYGWVITQDNDLLIYSSLILTVGFIYAGMRLINLKINKFPHTVVAEYVRGALFGVILWQALS